MAPLKIKQLQQCSCFFCCQKSTNRNRLGSTKNSGCFQLRPEKRLYIWPSLSETCLRPENQAYLWPLPAQSRHSERSANGPVDLCSERCPLSPGFCCLWAPGFRCPLSPGFRCLFCGRCSPPVVSNAGGEHANFVSI